MGAPRSGGHCDVALVVSLERSLLRPAARRSAEVLDALVAPDCREVGASGRRWSRAEVVEAVLAEDGLVLLELVTGAPARWARRTALWRRVAPGC